MSVSKAWVGVPTLGPMPTPELALRRLVPVAMTCPLRRQGRAPGAPASAGFKSWPPRQVHCLIPSGIARVDLVKTGDELGREFGQFDDVFLQCLPIARFSRI